MKAVAGLLLFILVFININCRGGFKGSPITSDQWKIFSYIPAKIDFIAYFDFDNIRNTEAWRNILKSKIEDKKFDKWINSFSNNGKEVFEKEISQIVISKSPHNKFLVLVVSDNPFNIFTKALDDTSRFEKLTFLGEKYYYDKTSRATRYYEINDKMMIITNNMPYLKNLAEQKQYSLDRNSAFIKLIEDIPDKSQYWFATESNNLVKDIHDKYFKEIDNGSDYKSALKRIQKITFCATLKNEINADATLTCWGDKSAYLIASGLKSAIAMNVFSHENYSLGKIMEKAEVKQANTQISITAKLDKKDIDVIQNVVNENLFIMNFY